MSYAVAAVLVPWKWNGAAVDGEGAFESPPVINDIKNWIDANGEWLYTWDKDGAPHHRTHMSKDLTGEHRTRLFDGKATALLLTVTLATAQHFRGDPRMFQLGWQVFDDDGELQSSNWDQPLDAASRTQALDWLENHGYSRAAVANRFGTGNSRREILDMLRVMFRE